MIIKELKLKIRNLVNAYKNNDEEGVVGWNKNLNIRPAYQREFVYKEKERNSVINTILNDFPLNVMYFAKIHDNQWEVMDGQQRIISICEFCVGNFSIDNRGVYFYSLPKDKQNKILDYELLVYECFGKNSEILDWFRVINIAGVKLTDQELRNISFTSNWLTDAKKYFSKINCPAAIISKDYVIGSPIRQELLERAISWIIKTTNDKSIEEYMGKHMLEPNAIQLWTYFKNVIDWVEQIFKVKRREMKGIDWNDLYIKYKKKNLDTRQLEQSIKELMIDEEVTSKSGIYYYVLNNDEKHLNLRSFSDSQKIKKYEEQNGICLICKKYFNIEKMEADHITPWSEGGKTTLKNCQMLCKNCNRRKANK